MTAKQEKPVRMSPPPAKKTSRVPGMGLGLLIGILFGLLVGAIVLLMFQLQRQDVVEELKDAVATSTEVAAPVVPEPIPITPRPAVFTEDRENIEIPEITASVPADKATDISERTDIVLTFSTDMDEDTFDTNSVTVVNKDDGKDLTDKFSLSYKQQDLTLSFKRSGDTFERGITIEVLVTTDVQSQEGVPLTKEHSFNFEVR